VDTARSGAESVHVRPPSVVTKTIVVFTALLLSWAAPVTARYARSPLTGSRTCVASGAASIGRAATGVTSVQLRPPSVVLASSNAADEEFGFAE
jgi:hypothetical protein